MRILLDTKPLTDKNRVRGVGTYTEELLSALRELSDLPEPLEIFASHELGATEKEQFDLIHYPYFDLFFPTLPKIGSVPTVVTVHDVIPLIFSEHYPVGLRGRFHLWKQTQRLKQASMVLTDSECSKDDIKKYLDIEEGKIRVTALAARSQLHPATEYLRLKVRQELSLPGKYILYIGDINYNKNLPTLLLALTLLPDDVHLCVVSSTFQNTEIPEGKELAKIIADNGLRGRVQVLSVKKEDTDALSGVIADSRCLVQPSLYEGFGLPVLEAMKVGTVVVSSTAGSLPEVAGDAAIMVEPTITGLVDGILQALSLRGEERESWIRRGQKHASLLSWKKTAEQTYAAYQAVLRERQTE